MTVTGINITDATCVLKNKHKEQYLKRMQDRDSPLLNNLGDWRYSLITENNMNETDHVH